MQTTDGQLASSIAKRPQPPSGIEPLPQCLLLRATLAFQNATATAMCFKPPLQMLPPPPGASLPLINPYGTAAVHAPSHLSQSKHCSGLTAEPHQCPHPHCFQHFLQEVAITANKIDANNRFTHIQPISSSLNACELTATLPTEVCLPILVGT